MYLTPLVSSGVLRGPCEVSSTIRNLIRAQSLQGRDPGRCATRRAQDLLPFPSPRLAVGPGVTHEGAVRAGEAVRVDAVPARRQRGRRGVERLQTNRARFSGGRLDAGPLLFRRPSAPPTFWNARRHRRPFCRPDQRSRTRPLRAGQVRRRSRWSAAKSLLTPSI